MKRPSCGPIETWTPAKPRTLRSARAWCVDCTWKLSYEPGQYTREQLEAMHAGERPPAYTSG